MMADAAAINSAAEMISAIRAPNRKASACAINEPNTATPSTLPVCRVELSTPAATPEREKVSEVWRDVRFTPESGHCWARPGCPLCAKSGRRAVIR